MKRLLTILLLSTSSLVFSQNRSERVFPNQQKYKDIMADLGSPLSGKPVLILNYFAEKEGSYLFYINETPSKNQSYIDDKAKDLYAGLFIEDHGGLSEIITFKDFSGPLSQPNYFLDQCIAVDADGNKSPEFYLTYFENSDGLDAKPLKVIVYSKNGKSFVKSKITTWISYQPEDKERIEKDENFKKLPISIQKKAEELSKKAKVFLN
jgi:hypothetical protein